ncbi:hypothetical protein PSP6_800005 [Paraburkholderia tropica]|uniref:hypothetical protein n=1 Tax=Paraburkholderia tropica TaxID=92647 RepID=UPI001CAF909D|nr:hypothetical protein [Paraburkholderia tropica]CAG9239337.1 hypothetical protein PSP6_800005 [Paraburkholderia tropica]
MKTAKNTAKAVKLPRDVEDAIAGATYMQRAATDEGHRTLFWMVGLGHLIVQQTPNLQERVSKAWPNLRAEQVAHVLRAIDAGVAASIARERQAQQPTKAKYSTNYFIV